MNKRLSNDDKTQLSYLYTHHVPMSKIAGYLDVTLSAVRNQVLSLRLDQLPISSILLEADLIFHQPQSQSQSKPKPQLEVA